MADIVVIVRGRCLSCVAGVDLQMMAFLSEDLLVALIDLNRTLLDQMSAFGTLDIGICSLASAVSLALWG